MDSIEFHRNQQVSPGPGMKSPYLATTERTGGWAVAAPSKQCSTHVAPTLGQVAPYTEALPTSKPRVRVSLNTYAERGHMSTVTARSNRILNRQRARWQCRVSPFICARKHPNILPMSRSSSTYNDAIYCYPSIYAALPIAI
jgi:hypothetical protein